jgi:light-regulated signal transduction histidine kinase (bacteriophytochrome)
MGPVAVESRRLTVRPEDVDLGVLLSDVIEATPEVRGRCRIGIDPRATVAWADPGRVVQVMSNLFIERRQIYGAAQTPIDVRLEPVEGMVQVNVTKYRAGGATGRACHHLAIHAHRQGAQRHGAGLGLGL